MSYFKELDQRIASAGDKEIAQQKEAYMKNHFAFHGVMANDLRGILKDYWSEKGIPSANDMEREMIEAWTMKHREVQLCAMEVLNRGHKDWHAHSWQLFEHMITNLSWWDTVDYIAATLVYKWSLKFPDEYEKVTDSWCNSDNMWLNRVAIIFQLKLKDKTRTDLLERYIVPHLGSSEFFHQKAIGWALRQYGKFNPNWVVDFSNRHELKPLSRREALRLIPKA